MDVLVGGGGNDHIYGGGGNDTIGAQDGERDWISCGTNGAHSVPDRDVVYADRVDNVARDCEVVHRR
jgi:Ca2+-binding RTX toxin-like protein